MRDYTRELNAASAASKLLVMTAMTFKKPALVKEAVLAGADLLSVIYGERIELDLPITEEEMLANPEDAKKYYEEAVAKARNKQENG